MFFLFRGPTFDMLGGANDLTAIYYTYEQAVKADATFPPSDWAHITDSHLKILWRRGD